MGKPESNFWEWLDLHVGPSWDAQRHEDKYSVGIPDVSYGVRGINGWIELKAYAAYSNSGLPKLTAKQASWLTRRGEAGGNCYIMARIGRDILLWSWESAYALRDVTCGETVQKKLALRVWHATFNVKEFLEIITNGK